MKVSSSGALVEKKPEMIFMWVQVGHGIHSRDGRSDLCAEERGGDEGGEGDEMKEGKEEDAQSGKALSKESCRHQKTRRFATAGIGSE